MRKTLLTASLFLLSVACFAQTANDDYRAAEQRAQNGDVEAMMWLGNYFYSVTPNSLTTSKIRYGDIEKAEYWYKKAYKKGSLDGMYCYAAIKEDAKLMKKAADKGHYQAAYDYAEYLLCQGGSRDKQRKQTIKAIRYLVMAADGGYGIAHAYWRLGKICEYPDTGYDYYSIERAKKYYTKGYEAGDEQCGRELRRMSGDY